MKINTLLVDHTTSTAASAMMNVGGSNPENQFNVGCDKFRTIYIKNCFDKFIFKPTLMTPSNL